MSLYEFENQTFSDVNPQTPPCIGEFKLNYSHQLEHVGAFDDVPKKSCCGWQNMVRHSF